jgi:uncharacterized protein
MEGIFLSLYKFFRRRRIVFLTILLLGGFFAAYFASKITLVEDISGSIRGENDQMAFIINHSRLTNKIIIPVFLRDTAKPAEPEKLIAIADGLIDSLRSKSFSPYLEPSFLKVNDTLFENIMELFYENLPLFLEEDDYRKLDSLLMPHQIDKSLEKNIRTLTSPTGFALKKYILQDPLGMSSLALSKLKQFQIEDGYEILGGYIFTNKRKILLLFIDPVNPPSETRLNAVFFNRLDKLLGDMMAKTNNSVKAEYYGASAVAVGNAKQIKKDIALTVTMAIVIILIFIGWFFRKASIPFISFLPAVFGGITTLALLYLARGKMSTIALGIGSVLLGIIVDYALYFYSLYKSKGSVELVIRDMSMSIAMCSLTSATAFFSLLFVRSEVLKDLGLFAGLAILGAAFFSLVILPHLIKMEAATEGGNSNPVSRMASYTFESNRVLIAIILMITVVFIIYSKRTGFETDMYSINYMSPGMKETEKDLNRMNNLTLKSVYIISAGKNLDQALSANSKVLDKLENLKSRDVVRKFSNAGTILISNSIQRQRAHRWNEYWSPEKKRELETILIREGEKYGFNRDAFKPFFGFISRNFMPLDISSFSSIRNLLLNDMVTETKDMTLLISLVKVKNENRRQVFTEFSGVDNCTVIDRQEITSGLVDDVRKDFDLMVKLCLIFVTLTLIIFFGRIETGLIAAIPMVVSWLWTLGFMGAFGIKFNIINIIVSTFVFGLGVDYSILMMRGFLLEYKYGQRELVSYKTSIFLSAFTTIVGVGVLILARHPSLHSIALISVVGLLSVVLISYTIEPLLFNWLIIKKKKRRILPFTFSDLLTTCLVFGLFIAGSLLLNLVLLVVILLPVSTWQKKYIMHQSLSFCCKLPVYAMMHIRKSIVNTTGEDFSRPAVIVCNHQSHIDLLLLLMLHPKIIAVTTKWVWNNPIYALVIRYLEFYPVADGYGEITEKLKPSLDNGYSILVFPEGSRSIDASIKRFHKGAFLIAEKLGLDILPMIIHGASDCMNKGENHLRGGSVTIKIYPRIKSDDLSWGHDYHERTRAVQSFYRREWLKLREELETPSYFRGKLIRNYIFKGPVLEWYTRIKIGLEDNYEQYNRYIPRRASIVDLGCGYGFLSYMLSFVSDERHILGIDYDAEKIELANHCISRPDRVEFVVADVSEYPLKMADVFILSDVLHYLPYAKQESLLLRCIRQLNSGGIILIRDADKDLEKRHMGTRYTEFFSTRSGFNKTERKRLYFFSGKMIQEYAGNHGLQFEIVDSTKLTSNLLYVLRK